jgi:hypothetical protein
VAAIFEMAAILYSFSVGTISNIVQYTNIYHYATFDAVWPDISMIFLLNGTKPGRSRDGLELGRVAAIFKMAAILECFQLLIYPILFSLSISTSMQHLMLFRLIYLYDISVEWHEALSCGGHL